MNIMLYNNGNIKTALIIDNTNSEIDKPTLVVDPGYYIKNKKTANQRDSIVISENVYKTKQDSKEYIKRTEYILNNKEEIKEKHIIKENKQGGKVSV